MEAPSSLLWQNRDVRSLIFHNHPEGKIMVKVASLFSQLLSHFPRNEFARLVGKHQAERHAKGFTCWAQFVAMLFCQLAHADSLREITNGLRCSLGKLKPLGLKEAPGRSTLAYANAHRCCELYRDLFFAAYAHFQDKGGLGVRKARFRFKNKLLSFDSTTISLCLSLFPWAKFRKAKGGVKVHVGLDHDTYLPVFVHITDANLHDVKGLRLFSPNPGSIVAMDRGYVDYALFGRWTEQGIYFVTRLKDNAGYVVVEQRPVPQRGNILADQIVRLTGIKAEEKCPHPLRRVVAWDEKNEREIVLLTNHLESGATTIAAIYKDRWEIELFFKAIKQTLKIKSFVGESENTLRIQIWTALITILILKWLHHLSTAQWSFSNLASMLRLNLFTYRDLTAWLTDPWNTEPIVPGHQQLALPLVAFGQPRGAHRG
jgi:hypothetical protein